MSDDKNKDAVAHACDAIGFRKVLSVIEFKINQRWARTTDRVEKDALKKMAKTIDKTIQETFHLRSEK